IWADTSGWHIGSTGLPADAVSAVNMGGTHPQGLALKNGVVQHIYTDTSGWHIASTTHWSRQASAVNMGGQWPQALMLQ
ncbi:hypothetical protein, partial [Catelliglobosispora koreensis]|uniref:hypothetical protein n=1 Tax=Catelliglobosispora koreensis TaxID=129052 RepID=UPI001B7F9442